MRNTWILFKDELLGFAKSWAMIAMWVGLPLLGILLYYRLEPNIEVPSAMGNMKFTAAGLIGMVLSSLAATLAAILVSVEIVNEKNRKVYDLFFIRPIYRGHLMWAKFFAVVVCVSIALALALFTGLVVDVLRGVAPSPMIIEGVLESFVTSVFVIGVSTSAGILTGVISKSVIVAVMIVWFVGQNLILVPEFPTYFGLPDYKWVAWISSMVLVSILMGASALIFRRMEY